MPSSPPTTLPTMELNDMNPAPHSDGSQLPTAEPTTIPVMVARFDISRVYGRPGSKLERRVPRFRESSRARGGRIPMPGLDRGHAVAGVFNMRNAARIGAMCVCLAMAAASAFGAALMLQPAIRTGTEMSPALAARVMRPIEQHVAIGLEARGDLADQTNSVGYAIPLDVIGGHWLVGQRVRTYSAGPVMRVRIGHVDSGAPYATVSLTADAERRTRLYTDHRDVTDWQIHAGGVTMAAGLSSSGPFGLAFEMGHHAGAGSSATDYSYIAAGLTWR